MQRVAVDANRTAARPGTSIANEAAAKRANSKLKCIRLSAETGQSLPQRSNRPAIFVIFLFVC